MPVSTDALLRRKISTGDAYVVSEISTGVADGDTFNIHIANPEDSDIVFHVVDATVTSNGEYVARIHDSFENDPSDGTDVEIQSLLLDTDESDDDGIAVAQSDVSFTNGSTHAVGVGGGGRGGSSVGGPSHHAIMTMEPGREIVIEVENTSGDSQDYAITVVYTES